MGLFGTTARDIRKWENTEQVDKIVKALNHKDFLIKSAANEAMVNLIRKWENSAAVEKIAKYFFIEDPVVQKTAVNALGNFKIIEAIKFFIKMLNHAHSSVREEAVEAIMKLGPDAEKHLTDAWEEITQSALHAFPYKLHRNPILIDYTEVNYDDATKARIHEHIFSQVRTVRTLILEILSRLDLSYIPACFKKAIYDYDKAVARAAIKALGNSDCMDAISILKPPLNNFDPIHSLSTSPFKYEIDDALSKLESKRLLMMNISTEKLNDEVFNHIIDTQDLPKLLKVLKNVSDFYQLKTTIITIGEMGSKEALKPLIELCGHPNNHIKLNSALSLIQIGAEKQAYDTLIRLLKDKDDDIVSRSVQALGEIRNPDATPILVSLFHKHSNTIAKEVVNALVLLQQFKVLDELLSTEDIQKRIIVAQAFDKTNAKATDILKKLLFQDQTETSVLASRALISIGAIDNQLIEYLQNALLKEMKPAEKNKIADCLIEIAKKDFSAVRQNWTGIKKFIKENIHNDNHTYRYSDCPSDSGVHTDSGIFLGNITKEIDKI